MRRRDHHYAQACISHEHLPVVKGRPGRIHLRAGLLEVLSLSKGAQRHMPSLEPLACMEVLESSHQKTAGNGGRLSKYCLGFSAANRTHCTVSVKGQSWGHWKFPLKICKDYREFSRLSLSLHLSPKTIGPPPSAFRQGQTLSLHPSVCPLQYFPFGENWSWLHCCKSSYSWNMKPRPTRS